MEKNIGVGRALGKIILMGEHAVVYGQPALALPFPAVETKAFISKRPGPVQLDCIYYKDELVKAPDILLGLSEMVKGIVEAYGEKLEGFEIRIESTIPPERGLGSSAAVALATSRALYKYFNKPLSYEDQIKWAGVSEKIVHGNPSGIDSATIGGEEALYYIKGQPFQSFEMKLDGYLLVADSGRKGQTKEAVSSLRAWIEDNPVEGEGLIKELGDLARLSKEAVENNQLEVLGQAMNQAHEILDRLGVSDPGLNQLVGQARKEGALGAKLTGGGRGGAIIALVKNKEDGLKIGAKLKDAGARNTWIYNLRDGKDDK